MAGGKQSPRQKMINLMYLVFIAMLALNMSKEVLVSFGIMNETLEEANETAEQRNASAMAGLALKATESKERYEPLHQDAQQIDALAQELSSYISNLKTQLLEGTEEGAYEEMDKSNELDELFFAGGKITPEGEKFLGLISKFRTGVVSVIGDEYPAIAEEVNDKFSTNEVTVDGAKVPWLKYRYEGFPLIASVTNLTQMQAQVKQVENDILSRMLAGELQSEASMSNYGTILETPKSAYYQGETFNGAIVLGRTDATTKPERVELTLDGRPLGDDDYDIEGGRVVLNVSAGNAGQHKIEGQLVFAEGGEETVVPVSQEFSVIPKPNSAVISADKMNVLYRGVSNPITISMPGVPDNNINASAPGLSRSGSGYVMNVTTLQAREVKINVTGTIDGEQYGSSQTFRVKDIPSPVGTVRGESGVVKMQRNALEISDIGATLPDFDFDLNLKVKSFKFKVPGQPTVQVNGSRLDAQAKQNLTRAGRGETVQIFDINAELAGNSGYKLKQISPVIIELTN